MPGESWTRLVVSGADTPASDSNAIALKQQIKIEQPFEKCRTQESYGDTKMLNCCGVDGSIALGCSRRKGVAEHKENRTAAVLSEQHSTLNRFVTKSSGLSGTTGSIRRSLPRAIYLRGRSLSAAQTESDHRATQS